MTGLELSRRYYAEVGRPALEKQFPDLLSRMAVGLAGEGSECFGFDDAVSRDHDWGPGFCIWLGDEDYKNFGKEVQALYEGLPGGFAGFPARVDSPQGVGRIGCLCTSAWYTRYIGFPRGPETLAQWRRVPEAFLATVTNGAIFWDPAGDFTAVREGLLEFYPEDIRLKKLAARAAVMAQAGQYNYPRCFQRGEAVAAGLALAEFTKAAMSMVYLLNRRYAPFYKWMHRGLRGMPCLPRAYDQLLRLACAVPGPDTEEAVEGICLTVAAELRRQGLSDSGDSFLMGHGWDIMRRIQDPVLRQSHIMEE